jgi:hypothetical protein
MLSSNVLLNLPSAYFLRGFTRLCHGSGGFWPLTAEARVSPGEDFPPEFFGFPLPISFHWGSILILWAMNNRPSGGLSLETKSYPIDMNNRFPH